MEKKKYFTFIEQVQFNQGNFKKEKNKTPQINFYLCQKKL